MEHAYLASAGIIIDVVFFVLLVSGLALGVKRGFINGVCKLAGTFFSLIFAFVFCVSFANFLESAFGMTSAIANGLSSAFSKNENLAIALTADTTGAELKTALTDAGVSGFFAFLIGIGFKNAGVIQAGATGAMLLGSLLAKWISILIAFVSLLVIIRFGVWLVAKLLSTVVEKVKAIRITNRILGGLLGLAQTFVAIFLLLSICSWLPIEGLHNVISSASVVGAIFNSEWFAAATSYAVSGSWFNDYLTNLLPQ